MDLVTLAREWAQGDRTLASAMNVAAVLEYPVMRDADDGRWADGDTNNTITAVQALVGTDLTFEQFEEFSTAFARI